MRNRVLFVAFLLAFGASVFAGWHWYREKQDGNRAITGAGIIEVTQVDVAFELPGRMAERFVDEGAMVDGGEPIARLDEREYALRVEQARAAREAAEARYKMMLRGSREQVVDQALAGLEAAESALRLQNREHDRIAALAAKGIVSQDELDKIATARSDARATRDRAAAQLELLREGFRTEEIQEARAHLAQASSGLELAELNLARCKLYAPLAGRVLSKSREPGEMVQPGSPIVTIGDLLRPWVNVYVGERDLGKVHLGMQAWVTVDSFPDDPFPGRVTFIAERAEFTPKNIQTPDERVKLVYRVKVEVEARDGALKPGMPADAVLPLEGAVDVARRGAE